MVLYYAMGQRLSIIRQLEQLFILLFFCILNFAIFYFGLSTGQVKYVIDGNWRKLFTYLLLLEIF